MNSKPMILRLFLFGGLMMGCSMVNRAQETKDSSRQLNEVILIYQADARTPVTFQNISSKELKTKNTGQEPSFLLSETPSVTNYSDAGNSQGYSYFRMRGIDQTRINITLDGMPLNEPEDQGGYFSNFADILNSVSKIQIQRGVGTSKNGVASYGGSLQLFSPNLMDSAQTTVGFGYGSFNSLRAFASYQSGVKNNKALYARVSEVYSDGYKHHSSNHSQSAFISGGLFRKSSVWKLNIMAGHQQNQMAWLGVSEEQIKSDRRYNVNTPDEKDRFIQALAQLQHGWRINSRSKIESSLYYNTLKGNYDLDLNNYLGLPSTSEMYNYAFASHMTGFFSNYTLTSKGFNWTTGLHGNLYNRQHTGSEKTLGRLYRNTGYKNDLSVFTKATYSYRLLTLFADMQYRYTDFRYKGSVDMNTLNWTFFNPKAGLQFNINPTVYIYYSLGRSGREPTRNDMFGGSDDLSVDDLGQPMLGNTRPERVIDHELGVRYRNEKIQLGANLYYMDFKNEIVLDGKFGPNGLALTNNVEQSLRAGAELHVHYRLSNYFSLINNSSFNYSRIKEQKEIFKPILTPPIIVNQEVQYEHNRFTVALSGRYQGRSFIDFANSAAVNDYFLLNSSASWQQNKWRFSVFLNNITGSKNINNGYVDYDGTNKYFVQAPFNWYTAVQFSF